MDFVTHTCKKCGCAFVAEDYTNAQDIPPHWRLCPECAEKAGIDYNSQKPWNSRTPEQQARIERNKKFGIENLKKYQEQRKQNNQKS